MNEWDDLKVGMVREQDGAKEICINPCASYAGGSGPLWARVGAEAQLTTDKTWAYIRGICCGITPDKKAIQFEITHSSHTWGLFMAGQTITLSLEEIQRYDHFYRFTSHAYEATPERLFEKLYSELSEELEQRFRSEIGSVLYDKIIEIDEALDQAREAYIGLPSDFQRGSLRNWEKAKKRISKLLESIVMDD